MRLRHALSAAALFVALPACPALGAIPEQVSYQGLLTDGMGNPMAGPVNMVFRIYDSPGGTLLWSETQNGVTLSDGVFDVLLGAVTPLTIGFDAPRYLVTEVDGNIIGSPRLLGASPYSLGAAGLADGAGVRSLNGLRDDLRIVGGTNVTVSEAGDSISIAATGGGGGADADWDILGNDLSMIPTGSVGIGTTTPSGKVHVYTENIAGTSVLLEDGGTASLGYASLGLRTPLSQARVEVIEQPGNERLLLQTLDPEMYVRMDSDNQIEFRPGKVLSMQLDSNGLTRFVASDGGTGVAIAPSGGQAGGGEVGVRNDAGTTVGRLESNPNDGGRFELLNETSDQAVHLTANNAGLALGGGRLKLGDEIGLTRVVLEAAENGVSSEGGLITMYNDQNQATAKLDGDFGDTNAARLGLWSAANQQTVNLYSQAGTGTTSGAGLQLYDGSGNMTIHLDANYGGTGEGRVITEALEITGGADLSEQFSIASPDATIEAGMVVVIDPDRPGGLTLGDRAYDPRVAGVVSGAGGVKPGMLMGQRGTAADGDVPVALSGRVYCWVDASYGAVEPGDLLTTSDTPGHAMRVSDIDRSHGTILGKAMTALPEGRGLVLILVALQ